MSKPFFSVIVPVYNAEKFIISTLESIESQTMNNFEVIVVNDGSTDNSLNLILTYMKNTSLDIELINQDNSGVSKSRNLGIEKSKGKYICFLDADDQWYSQKLEVCYKLLFEKPIKDIIWHQMELVSNVYRKRNNMRQIRNVYFPITLNLLYKGNPIVTSSVIIKSSILKLINGFNEDLKSGEEDYDLYIRISKVTDNFFYLNQTLGIYNFFGEGLSSSLNQHAFATIDLVIRHFKDYCEQNKKIPLKKILRMKNYRISFEYIRLARINNKLNKNNFAIKHIISAIKTYPYNPKQYIIFLLILLSFLKSKIRG